MEFATEFPNEMALWMSCGSCVRSDFGFVKHCAHWSDPLGIVQNIRQRPVVTRCVRTFRSLAHTSLSCVDAREV
jgi:hypothetical protein